MMIRSWKAMWTPSSGRWQQKSHASSSTGTQPRFQKKDLVSDLYKQTASGEKSIYFEGPSSFADLDPPSFRQIRIPNTG